MQIHDVLKRFKEISRGQGPDQASNQEELRKVAQECTELAATVVATMSGYRSRYHAFMSDIEIMDLLTDVRRDICDVLYQEGIDYGIAIYEDKLYIRMADVESGSMIHLYIMDLSQEVLQYYLGLEEEISILTVH